MLRLHLHTLEKIKDPSITAGIAEYEKRLSRFCRFKMDSGNFKPWKTFKTNGFTGDTSGRTLLVFTTGRGTLPSEGLATLFSSLALSGHSDLDIVVDLDGEVEQARLEAPSQVIPLTDAIHDKGLLTLLVVEQIYRAFKIEAGESYHK